MGEPAPVSQTTALPCGVQQAAVQERPGICKQSCMKVKLRELFSVDIQGASHQPPLSCRWLPVSPPMLYLSAYTTVRAQLTQCFAHGDLQAPPNTACLSLVMWILQVPLHDNRHSHSGTLQQAHLPAENREYELRSIMPSSTLNQTGPASQGQLHAATAYGTATTGIHRGEFIKRGNATGHGGSQVPSPGSHQKQVQEWFARYSLRHSRAHGTT